MEPVDNLFVSIVEKLFNVQEENEINEFVKHLALELGEKIRERTMDNEVCVDIFHLNNYVLNLY